ncbi:hypothetical protein D9619_012256 [Psilocybe cf. subviscida]|uniref:Metallo-beta-lactamase domain-containing protein n=1 Tax=Psilocybe cf. subviscida TaxID=2480587 RepID=A0A8H5B7J3_9AGAR|nr:hypothetical protein D9619_012256 [Psilocybe cf. subviscida]
MTLFAAWRYLHEAAHPFYCYTARQSHGAYRSFPSPSPVGLLRLLYPNELRHRTISLASTPILTPISNYRMPETFPELGDITRLSPHVVRILGQNPGKFTLQGTNTYLIGTQNPYILIDTGEGLPAYLPVLQKALDEHRTSSSPLDVDVSDIIISHWHHDHVGGLPGVLGLLKELWDARNPGKPYTPPRIHKHTFPASATKGHHHSHYNQLPRLLKELPQGLFSPPESVPVSDTPDPATLASGPEFPGVLHPLADNQLIHTSHGTTLLQVLHTPGHTADSICLYIPQDRALYTADTVLGHGTAVFEDLAVYLSSLNRMLSFGANEDKGKNTADDAIDLAYVSLYPAHGAVVANGRETIATYIKHRLEREAQIVGVLNSPVPVELNADSSPSPHEASGTAPLWSTWNIVRVLYKSYPENLWQPAARGVDLHLRKLEGDGLVKLITAGVEGEEHHSVWRLLISPPGTPSL